MILVLLVYLNLGHGLKVLREQPLGLLEDYMSRYNIALGKKSSEKKLKKAFVKAASLLPRLRPTQPTQPQGGQDSTQFINMINATRSARRVANGQAGQALPDVPTTGPSGESIASGGSGQAGESIQGQRELPIVQGDTGYLGDTGIYAQGETGPVYLGDTGIYAESTGDVGFGSTPPMTAMNADGSIITSVPISQFFMLTGPNGRRILIPLRRLRYSIINHSTDDLNTALTIRLRRNEGEALQNDILEARRRLGINEPVQNSDSA